MGKTEILSWVKRAEEDADETLRESEEEAQTIRTKARTRASEIVSESRATGQEDARALVDEARAAAGKEAAMVSVQGDEQITAIRANSESQRDAAVAIVIASFMAD